MQGVIREPAYMRGVLAGWVSRAEVIDFSDLGMDPARIGVIVECYAVHGGRYEPSHSSDKSSNSNRRTFLKAGGILKRGWLC